MALVRLRDLEGVGALEWALTQGPWIPAYRDRTRCFARTEEIDEHGDQLAEYLFGVCDDDLDEVEASHFEEVERMMRDESDAFWASHGWDVTDGEGKQLLAMRYLLGPLVCVVKGLHPDANSPVEADAWGARLEEEARRFKSSR